MSEVIKCYVCGHTKDRAREYKEITRYYERGKKKGEVKGIDKDWVDVDPDTEDFINIYSLLGDSEDIVTHVRNSEYYSIYDYDSSKFDRVYLVACPKCGTIKMEIYEE